MSAYKIFTLSQKSNQEATQAEFWRIRRPPKAVRVQCRESALRTLGLMPARALAVVGTRRPTQRSINEARRCIHALGGSNLVIVSGLARGIDAVAHESAIEAGLATVAVLACGLDTTYPPEHGPLRERILASGGLVISAYNNGATIHPGNFIERNRLIAGWSNATWVVEAPERSGALNTACWARSNNRRTFATPCFPGDIHMAGNQKLIDKEHAEPVWGPGSLGVEWMELISHEARTNHEARITTPGKSAPADKYGAFIDHIAEQTRQCGGTTAEELVDWATALGWMPPEMFEALQKAVDLGIITEQGGLLLKKPA